MKTTRSKEGVETDNPSGFNWSGNYEANTVECCPTIVAAASALAQSESKAAPSKRSVEGQLIELERQLSEALVKEDAAILDHLWSNDLVFTFPNEK